MCNKLLYCSFVYGKIAPERSHNLITGLVLLCGNYRFIVLFIELKAYRPVNCTGTPQGVSQVQISHKLNTIQSMHIIYKYKHKHHLKVSPFDIVTTIPQ